MISHPLCYWVNGGDHIDEHGSVPITRARFHDEKYHHEIVYIDGFQLPYVYRDFIVKGAPQCKELRFGRSQGGRARSRLGVRSPLVGT